MIFLNDPTSFLAQCDMTLEHPGRCPEVKNFKVRFFKDIVKGSSPFG